MKLAKQTFTGGLVCVFAFASLAAVGCDSGSDSTGTADPTDASETDPEDDGSDTEDLTTGGPTTTTTGETDDTTDPGSTTEETTGPPPEGLGCDAPPSCDGGEYDGSLTITSSDQIGEIAGFTSIKGRLAVAETDLTCLTFLSCLETVGHDVNIFGNEFLTDVSGTDNITEVGFENGGKLADGGSVIFSENSAITDLNGFNGIQQTQLALNIGMNASMSTISGFTKLVGTQGNFTIRFNPLLKEIVSDGLRDIKFIGGECVVTNNENLCITTVVDMCDGLKQGPSGGSTANNADC